MQFGGLRTLLSAIISIRIIVWLFLGSAALTGFMFL